jgi:MFS family permease
VKLVPTFSKDPQTEKSLRHSIKDGVAYSMMTGSGEGYFSAFAVFLKASAPQVALLASLPPLLASFFQLFAVYLGQHFKARKSIVVVGALLQAVALFSIALLPVFYREVPFAFLLLLVVIYYSGAHLGAPLWGSLMGAIVPTNVRGNFFGTRTRFSSIASFSALIVAGIILQIFDFNELTRWGFTVIFLLGVVARVVSAFHLQQIHDPPHQAPIAGDVTSLFQRGFLSGQSRFLRFSLFFALMQGSVAISGPLIAIYLLRDLEFSYLELTINTAASVLMQFLVLQRWGRLSDLFGNRIILRTTGFGIALIPLTWMLSTDFYYLLAVQALSGLLWSGFSLSAANFVYDLTEQDKRAGLMALHAVVAAIGVFVGATVGGVLAVLLPNEIAMFGLEFSWLTAIYGVLVISALARLIVALTFLPRMAEVRDVRRMSYSGLLFRVTRFSPVSGVIFEVVNRRPRRPAAEQEDNVDVGAEPTPDKIDDAGDDRKP